MALGWGLGTEYQAGRFCRNACRGLATLNLSAELSLSAHLGATLLALHNLQPL